MHQALPKTTQPKPALLALEFFLLCLALPTVIIVFRLAPMMFFFLWSATLYTYVVYRLITHGRESFRSVWKWSEVNWANLRPILIRFAVVAVAMVLFVLWYDPDRLFALPRYKPEIILPIIILYPLLSAIPQEFVFCTFFFERYRRFFPTKWAMVLASSVVFAYAHVLFINPVAPTLSFIAGLIFASTYMKTRSLALVSIEHGLYGNAMFIIGLGWYFYSGSMRG